MWELAATGRTHSVNDGGDSQDVKNKRVERLLEGQCDSKQN